MNYDIVRKRLTKLYENCQKCWLPTIACICNHIQVKKSKNQFLILLSQRESFRSSNTAHLFKLTSPSTTTMYSWERTKVDLEFLNQIRGDTFLVYPATVDDLKIRKLQNQPSQNSKFLLIDGTWKETNRIIKKSVYLNSLPLLALESSAESNYLLRKGSLEGTMCTIEAIIKVLEDLGDVECASAAKENFSLFLKAFNAGKSGHELKFG